MSKDEQPDAQYGSRQVTTVQDTEASGAAGGSRRLKLGEKPWWHELRKYTFEDMLDAPCKMQSGIGKPKTHSTRDSIGRIICSKEEHFHLHPYPHHLKAHLGLRLATSTRAKTRPT